MKIFLIPKNKKNGFTLIEVMFAVVIVTISFSGIFLFIGNMIKFLEKTRSYADSVAYTPPIFSSDSFLLNQKKVQNYISEKELYSHISKIDQAYIANFDCFCIADNEEKLSDKNFIKKSYSNFFYKNTKNGKKDKSNE